ncbi:hypothetical protein Atai01_32390 [Amycolatopsis taiwanensis]|uniref:Uncharacterized protein n=1 Tax=Amycolatopsis taiwanensis TaxID=342230 RepID=A0A9W6VFA9_9PSEU|nr:hypothetical protein Atai01_32390 [Amycolatopsis taiwanensis]
MNDSGAKYAQKPKTSMLAAHSRTAVVIKALRVIVILSQEQIDAVVVTGPGLGAGDANGTNTPDPT